MASLYAQTVPRTLKKQKKGHSRELARPNGSSLLVQGCRVWTRTGLRKASILIIDGKIARIARSIPKDGFLLLRANGKVALPGMIDAHVHLRDMELSYKEDFTTGTNAAAAGGFTTVLDMPNTKPATDSPQRFMEKIVRAEGRIVTNVGFHVAAVPDALEIQEMSRLGAYSIKLYMPRPISPMEINDGTLLRLFNSSKLAGLPVTIHAEDVRQIQTVDKDEPHSPELLASRRPEKAETDAVERTLSLSAESKCRVHFCHLTLASSILSTRKYGPNATSEVTPHHMLLSTRTLASKGWRAWMVPPLRGETARLGLLAQVSKGSVDIIASDHAPHTIKEKTSTVLDPPPGIPGLETTIPLMLTLVNKDLISLPRLINMCANRPAQIFGLHTKGALKVGFDGDVTIVDMKAKGRVRAAAFFSKARFTPFEGMPTIGKVESTIVNGAVVFEHNEIVADAGSGRVLRRETAV